jgi:hypothetical protein
MAMRHFELRRAEPVSEAPVWSEGQHSTDGGQLYGLYDDFDLEPNDGLSTDSLEPGTILAVTTRNTRYRLTLLDRHGHALITGGSLFPHPTEVKIEGATVRGIIPKLGWIIVGLHLEMTIGGRVITTSPVKSIEPIAA